MIAVVASAGDPGARALVARWGERARMLTPADLSRRGWVHHPGWPRAGRAVIDGEIVPVRELTGVLSRLAFVSGHELPTIIPAERQYVAAEITAFLLAWLAELPCPVINRPSPAAPAGPSLRPEAWVALAARLGIPSTPIRRTADGYAYPAGERRELVTVVGRRALGGTNADARRRACALAAEAGAQLVDVAFDGSRPNRPLVDAHIFPDLGRAEVADALLELLAAPPVHR